MTVDVVTPQRSVFGVDAAKALASEIIAGTAPGEDFDARAVLEEHPGLASHRSVVIDLAYEEFCRRVDAGDPPDPREFAQLFPGVAQSLLHVLEVHQYLEHHPDALASEAAPGWPEAGQEFAGFALVREIGQGGFSRVFLARERNLGNREVVVKLCRQPNDEATRLGQLDHPQIVPVYSVQTQPDSGLTIICMPYLGSATLADVVAECFGTGDGSRTRSDFWKAIERANARHGIPTRGGFWDRRPAHERLCRGSYAEAIEQSGVELSEALAYAHRRGICHCDVKPSNVLLTADGRSLLLDFNLSMQRGGAAAIIGGTLPYMAPEQLSVVLADSTEGVSPIDHRADIFSLGVTLFQLLTGRLPFPVDGLDGPRRQAAQRLLEEQRCREGLRGELERVVSPAVARLVSECLAFDRDQRPQLAEEVARRLRDDLRRLPRARRWVHSHAVAIALSTLIFIFVAAAFGIGLAGLPPRHLREQQMGVSRIETGDYAGARRCFDQALDARGDFTPARIMRGWANLKAAQDEGLDAAKRDGLLDAAHQDLDAGWRQSLTAESAASLAWCLAQREKFHEAKVYFSKAVELGLATPAVLNNLGYCLVRTRDLAAAADLLGKAVALDPGLQAAHHNMAIVQFRLASEAVTKAGLLRVRGRGEEAARLMSEAADRIRSSLAHIESARGLEPRSAHLEFAAARLYAYASTLPGDDSTDPNVRQAAFLEEAVRCCRAAVELHLPPDRLDELAVLAPKLKEDPAFRQVKSILPSAAAPPPTFLTDVYPSVRDRLLAVSH